MLEIGVDDADHGIFDLIACIDPFAHRPAYGPGGAGCCPHAGRRFNRFAVFENDARFEVHVQGKVFFAGDDLTDHRLLGCFKYMIGIVHGVVDQFAINVDGHIAMGVLEHAARDVLNFLQFLCCHADRKITFDFVTVALGQLPKAVALDVV